jgi:hypothetical protein
MKRFKCFVVALVLIPALVGILSVVSAFAIDFSGTPLAGYEPDDIGKLIVTTDPVKDPTLDVNWPMLGGVNDVPPATQGSHVAKLKWTNETDHKVEVGHYWNDSTLDLTNTDFIYIDVYVADESALSTDIGFWDRHWLTPWIGTDFEYLIKPGEWRSIPFYIGGLDVNDVNHIEALVFDNLAGVSGTIYLDNMRASAPVGDCHCARRVVFSGYTWCVLQSTWQMDAGPNCYTADQNDVYVDGSGYLHLSINYKDANTVPEPNWYCSGLIATNNLGYGTYVYTVDANTDLLDPNIVVGLFTYDVCDGGYHEIDVELTKWGDSADTNNAQYVVQPFDPWRPLESRDRFKITYSTRVVTHEFIWNPNIVAFRSYYGDYSPYPPAEARIRYWTYTGPNVPIPDKNNPRINFYLTNGDPPQNGRDADIVIKSFRYSPLGDDTPPDLSVSVSPSVLWPPNHKMIKVTPTWTLSDNCDSSPQVKLTGITVNEDELKNTFDPAYDIELHDGQTSDDIRIDPDGSIWLRAERSGGSTRVYTITYEAVDDFKNSAVASATVTVPHNRP